MTDRAPPDLAPTPWNKRIPSLLEAETRALSLMADADAHVAATAKEARTTIKAADKELLQILVVRAAIALGFSRKHCATPESRSFAAARIAFANGLHIDDVKEMLDSDGFGVLLESLQETMPDSPRLALMRQELNALALRGLAELRAFFNDEKVSKAAKANKAIQLLDRTGLGPAQQPPHTTTLIQAETVNMLAQTGGITVEEQAALEGIRDRYLKGEVAPPIEAEATVEAAP